MQQPLTGALLSISYNPHETCVNGNRLSERTERRLSSDKERHYQRILSPRPKPNPTEIPGWP